MEAVIAASGERAGRIRDEVIPNLMAGVAGTREGFCLVTTRLRPSNVAAPAESVRELRLGPLSREHTRTLLRQLGVAGIPQDLQKAVKFTGGQPLLIRVLAGLFRAVPRDPNDGLRKLLDELSRGSDARVREIRSDAALVRVLRSYATWLAGTPELALLHLASLFDRTPEEDAMHALLGDPGHVGGLLDDWPKLTLKRWLAAAASLRERELASPGTGLAIEMHPLVHACFASDFRAQRLAAWRAGHRVLYEHFRAVPEKELPDTLEEMQPLIRAVHHGCMAGEYRRANSEVGIPRIARGMEVYMLTELGAVQEMTSLLSSYLDSAWKFPPDSDLSPRDKCAVMLTLANCERLSERLDSALTLARRALRPMSPEEDPMLFSAGCAQIIRLHLATGRLRRGFWTYRRLHAVARRHAALFLAPPPTPLEASYAEYVSAVLALLLLYCGRRAEGERLLAGPLGRAREQNPSLLLLPSLAATYHGEWLLETGQTATLLRAIELGQTEFGVRRFEFNNTEWLLKGKAWTQQAIESKCAPGTIDNALTALDAAVNQARNFDRAFLLANALLGRARWHSHFGTTTHFGRDVNHARELSQLHNFRLIAADLSLLVCAHALRAKEHPRARAAFGEASRLVHSTGYALRRDALKSLQARLGV